jgi:hypothetical protein
MFLKILTQLISIIFFIQNNIILIFFNVKLVRFKPKLT